MKTLTPNAVSILRAVTALIAFTSPGPGAAQSYSDIMSYYMSHGADITSVPAAGKPGAAYYSQGADATSVHAAGQQGPAYFSDGADVTSVPAAGQAKAAYYLDGADATSVHTTGQKDSAYFSDGADVTSVHTPGKKDSAYFSDGADVTSVPAPGQPGSSYFSDGADVMTMLVAGQRSGLFFWQPASIAAAAQALAASTATEASSEQRADAGIAPSSTVETSAPNSEEVAGTKAPESALPLDETVTSEPEVPAVAKAPSTVTGDKNKEKDGGVETAEQGDAPEIPLYDLGDEHFDLGMHVVMIGTRIAMSILVLSVFSLVVAMGWQVVKWFRERD